MISAKVSILSYSIFKARGGGKLVIGCFECWMVKTLL